ncbi:MAG: TRAP transporter TatT component family protein, partial [Bacteroidota bacterium]
MKRLFLPFTAVVLFAGCVQTIAIRTMGGILDYGLEAFNEESDLQLAKESLGSNLKLTEALVKGDPENADLLLLLAQGYSSYALAFVEDEDIPRARMFYLRGRDYGLRILRQERGFRMVESGDLETFERALDRLSKDDVPAVFWTAFAWGSYINITRTDIEAFAALPRVNAMMAFVLKHDPSYYYGGAHTYFGSIIASTPAVLGGKPEIAKEHFEKAMSMTGGKFLTVHLY